MFNNCISKEDGQAKIERINARIEELKGYFVTEENLKQIKDECWNFAKFFIDKSKELWKYGNLELRLEIQGLIMPEGFIVDDIQIQPTKQAEFISSFDITSEVNRFMWIRAEIYRTLKAELDRIYTLASSPFVNRLYIEYKEKSNAVCYAP